MRTFRSALLVITLGVYATSLSAAPVLIDFETLSDSEDLTTQFAALGIVFSGATALVSGAVGGSLNEIDFPPFSGTTVVFDSTVSGIRVDFTSGASSVSGRFTYGVPITMTAYSGATVLGSVTSQFTDNTGSSLNPPNELLELAFASGITHVIIDDVPFSGGSFTLDNFFADTMEATGVPEPGTLLLVGLAGVIAAGREGLNGIRRGRRRTLP